MAGNKEGGRKAAITNKARHGENFYRELGRAGGLKGHTGGFAHGDNASKYGKTGGKVSRRGRVIKPGDYLRPVESKMLLGLGKNIVKKCVEMNYITDDEAKTFSVELANLLIANEWIDVFSTWMHTKVPQISELWFETLCMEVIKYHNMLVSGKDDAETSKEHTAIRSLCGAYKRITGRQVNVVQARLYLA